MGLRRAPMLALALGGLVLSPASSGSRELHTRTNASAGAQQVPAVTDATQPVGSAPGPVVCPPSGTAPTGTVGPATGFAPLSPAPVSGDDGSDEPEGGPQALFQPVATAPTETDPRFAQLPALTWRSVNSREEVVAGLYRADGTMDPDAVQRLAHLLRDLRTGEDSPVVTRTLQLLVRIATRFAASRIEVISGYRSGRRADGRVIRREGYHSVGSAIDFRMPGADLRHVAAYARTFAHVGVGYYPRDGFVHLDSREQTFFWENRARRHGWNRPLDRSGVSARELAWTAQADLPWDRPDEPRSLVLAPRTQPGSRRPHSHHGHHHASGHHHRHARSARQRVLHVFRGPESN